MIKYFVDYLSGGNLDIQNYQCLSLEKARIAIAQIANGIADLHKLKISHNDLKSDNVMVDNEGHITIVDFGLAKQFSSHNRFQKDWEALANISYQLITSNIAHFDHRVEIHLLFRRFKILWQFNGICGESNS